MSRIDNLDIWTLRGLSGEPETILETVICRAQEED